MDRHHEGRLEDADDLPNQSFGVSVSAATDSTRGVCSREAEPERFAAPGLLFPHLCPQPTAATNGQMSLEHLLAGVSERVSNCAAAIQPCCSSIDRPGPRHSELVIGSISAHLDFDLPGLGFLSHREMERQDAMLHLSFDLFRVNLVAEFK